MRVVLLTVDSVSGLIYPPVVAKGEERAGHWRQLFARAGKAGLNHQTLRGLTSDGAQGLLAYLRQSWRGCNNNGVCGTSGANSMVNCPMPVGHAAQALSGAAAQQTRKHVRAELCALIHNIIDAQHANQAEKALAALLVHPHGAALGRELTNLLDRILVHQMDYCRGLQRVSPEWYWRDFRLRLSHGRNHRSEQRLERAALLWAIYHNFTPAQYRSERKRHYCHPGLSALQVAGAPPGKVSYLDALAV